MTMTDGGALACHVPAARIAGPEVRTAVARSTMPTVALVGRPNVGKSTFFAQASGRYAEAANVPGTTVSVASREITLDGDEALLVDLPGTLTLADRSDGLPSFWRLLVDVKPDALVVVVDAGDLARHLPLVLACRDLGIPYVVAANLADEATARGIDLDLGRLSQLLAAPVYRTVGRHGTGVAAVVGEAIRLAGARRREVARTTHAVLPRPPYRPDVVRRISVLAHELATPRRVTGPTADQGFHAAVAGGLLSPVGAATLAAADVLEPERWAVAGRWAREVEQRRTVRLPLADRLARRATTLWPGLPLFGLVTIATLLFTMTIGTMAAAALSAAWAAAVSPVLQTVVTTIVPVPALARAMLWALDSGLLSMLAVGIPFVLSFYVLVAILEDSGYLAATAVLTDRLFNALGLPGRAAIPVLAATGCNVPAIYGTRVLDSRRERLLASFLIVLTPCSARSAVVVAALAPFAGPVAALAAFGVVAFLAIGAGLAANALVPGLQSPLVLELPTLRRPVARQVAFKAWFRFRSFVRTATPLMLAGSFILGLAYETGALSVVEGAIGPTVSGVLGLPPVAGIAIILAFLRKELALQLLIVLAIGEYGATATSIGSFMGTGQLFVYAVVTAISIPCVASLATLVDEFGWRPAVAMSGAAVGLAVGAGAILARLLGIA